MQANREKLCSVCRNGAHKQCTGTYRLNHGVTGKCVCQKCKLRKAGDR